VPDDADGVRTGRQARELLLDRQLPRFEARNLDTVMVDADTQRTYEAVRSLDPDQVGRTVPLMRLMVAVRGLPARLASQSRTSAASPQRRTLAADRYRDAFLLIDEEPGVEYVIGMIGKFMTARQLEFRAFAPAEFAGFGEPGYGKVALNFLVLPYGTGRSPLSTETRTVTTDPTSAQQFRRYWRIIGPFAGYIMRHWLTLAKQHAESTA
jgi:hypothetical protein